MFGIKRTVADDLFSKLVRHRDGFKCIRCGAKHEENSYNLGNSHYWGRNFKSVRYDFENCDTLCNIPCHTGKDSSNPAQFGWEFQKQVKGRNGVTEDGEYTKFKKKQLGKKFDELMIRAHTPCKIDEKTLRMGFKLMLNMIKKGKNAQIFGARC